MSVSNLYRAVLLLVLCPIVADAQVTMKYEARINDACLESFRLYDDNRQFVFERRCNDESWMCYGQWGERNDTLTLNSYVNSAVPLLDTIMSRGSDSDAITLKILDRHGVDMSEKVWACIRPEGRASVFFTKGPDNVNTVMRVDGAIALLTLERLFDRTIEIPVTEASDYTVKLKLSKDQIADAESKWYDMGMVRYKVTDSAFVSIPEGKEPVTHFKRVE